MIPPLSKPWFALLAIGGAAITSSFIAAPAQAEPPLPTCSSVPIKTIYDTEGIGYQCKLDGLTYTFSSDIVELTNPPPGGGVPTVNFSATSDTQVISFVNLYPKDPVLFGYQVYSPTADILPYSNTVNVLQEYTQTPSTAAPPSINYAATDPTMFPIKAPMILKIDVNFQPFQPGPDDSGIAGTLTSLTNTIRKTPGPLPIAGAGIGFAVSRKLRQRIKQAA